MDINVLWTLKIDFIFQYFIIVLIIFVVMLVGGILGYVFREKVRYSMEQEMYSSIKAYNEKKSLRRAWDDTQENVSILVSYSISVNHIENKYLALSSF